MKAEDMTPIETIEFLTLKAEQCGRLADHVKHMAQTIHQAYHQDQPGTFLDCPKAFCRDATSILFEVSKPYERKENA